ncbi:MAG: two pore domain potassium channel family protein [Streptosporangiales bacterium]|nr:two pore domain potassium channel family protein [Streptosporangiales bacterium]
MSDTARLAWERRTEWPLTLLALAFLLAYAVSVLYPDLPEPYTVAANVVSTVTWLTFALDYLVRLVLAEHRWTFVRRHPLDLAVLALPVLRPLRALRLVIVLTAIDRRVRGSFRGKAATYVGGSAVFVVFVGALAVLDAERGAPGATITTFGDALWWALTTVTTVGYGDELPVTVTGRLVAAGMMLAGIVLLGVVTASLASWFVEKLEEVRGEEQETQDSLEALVTEVRELRREVRELRADQDR